jgi:pimeloyl-ACP methyl ester carboxylesterase
VQLKRDIVSPLHGNDLTGRSHDNRCPAARVHHAARQGGGATSFVEQPIKEEDTMILTLMRCLVPAAIALLLVAISVPGYAQDVKYKSLVVQTPDGVSISAQDWGNSAGPEILFIHGFSQASLSWTRQVNSELAKEFRIITYDLRGHGNSDKPLEPEKYKESKAWADEVKAVIEAGGLKRPVLVGWSYGGRVIADYLKVHGAAGLAGLDYVDAVTKSDPSFFGEGLKVQPQMLSDDLATNIAATRQFLHNCFEKQPSQDDFETMLAFNMMVPPKVRANMGGRTLNIDDILLALKLPVLVTQGTADRLILPSAAKYTATTIPGAKLSMYDGIGHAPFWEDTARFNSELAAFVRAANKTN